MDISISRLTEEGAARLEDERLVVDGLAVEDPTAVGLARERQALGESLDELVSQMIEIGARVLSREQAAAEADYVRAEFLRGRNLEYVRAARALGLPDRVIMFRHILPNAMTAALTYLPFILAGSVTTLTSLDFLGFGLPVGSPSLGELLLQGKNNLNAPWLAFTGFVVIALMLSLLVFIGEAVRDAFNPRKVLA